jgi:hypothetical protein
LEKPTLKKFFFRKFILKLLSFFCQFRVENKGAGKGWEKWAGAGKGGQGWAEEQAENV